VKFIWEIIKFSVMVFVVYTSPLVINKMEDVYFKKVVATRVTPLTHNGRRYCSASHIRYKEKVYLVTNRHCCARRKGFATFIESGFEKKHNVLHVSSKHDVCIATSSERYGLYLDTNYEKGDSVRLIGYPRGMAQTIRKGDIFDISLGFFRWLPGFTMRQYIHVSALAYPGNSGSPVVDGLGRVVGLLFAGNRNYNTEGLVVPSEFIEEAFQDMIREKGAKDSINAVLKGFK